MKYKNLITCSSVYIDLLHGSNTAIILALLPLPIILEAQKWTESQIQCFIISFNEHQEEAFFNRSKRLEIPLICEGNECIVLALSIRPYNNAGNVILHLLHTISTFLAIFVAQRNCAKG